MISDEPIRLVRIRPHHVGFFSEYYINDIYLDRYPGEARKYGRKFVAEVKKSFDGIISDEHSLGILIVHGQNGDSICDLCRISNCDDRNLADSDNFKGRHSSGAILQTTGLEIGKVYTTDEFLERVRKLYPHKIPKR